jgi:hypothetical protein
MKPQIVRVFIDFPILRNYSDAKFSSNAIEKCVKKNNELPLVLRRFHQSEDNLVYNLYLTLLAFVLLFQVVYEIIQYFDHH